MNKYNQYFRQTNEQRYHTQALRTAGENLKYVLWGTIMGLALGVITQTLEADKLKSYSVIHRGVVM